ncbi:glutamine-hydrolyzing GMP synthase, partial [Bartonella sp. AA16SXTY]|uniref:glutamine-hydrolyzing GMP synthase n=1 Tax=Bartonella sp. AA16SXTY TaxID=3243429 RepID=UPI0035D090A8
MSISHSDTVLIIDFGSQVTQLIARRVRAMGVYCEVVPFQLALEGMQRIKPKAVILSGSPYSVIDEGSPRAPMEIFEMDIPVLGICYGQQIMCVQLGGKVASGHEREFGRAFLEVQENSALFEGVWEKGSCYQVCDRVTALPEGFRVIGTSKGAPYAAIADEKRRVYAVQFHPEVVHTLDGTKLLQNFVLKISNLKGNWSMASYREQTIAKIRQKVGKSRVICGLSGGVDSSVVAVLLHEAIGDQLTCILVD